MQLPALYRQRGAVLIVSLIILVMMTIIGVTALSMTTLETRMAVNSQQADLVFQGAESGIQDVINSGDTTNTAYSTGTDQMLLAMAAGTNTTITAPTSVTTPISAGPNASVTNTAQITYTGTPPCRGQDASKFVCYAFSIKATATLSNATQTHIRGVQRLGPGGS